MTDGLQIRGGAGPFHAAAIAALIQHVLAEEEAARRIRPDSHVPPAWVRAVRPRDPSDPLDPVFPDPRGELH